MIQLNLNKKEKRWTQKQTRISYSTTIMIKKRAAVMEVQLAKTRIWQ